jgi:hypothetical protein
MKCSKCFKRSENKKDFVTVLEGSVWRRGEMNAVFVCLDCADKITRKKKRTS